MEELTIRAECLCPASEWEQPTGEEVRQVLKLAGMTGGQAAKAVGLSSSGDRTVRRWIGGESQIPYAAWAVLCDYAGLGLIWRKGDVRGFGEKRMFAEFEADYQAGGWPAPIYKGSVKFSMNLDQDAGAHAMLEAAKNRARQLVADEGRFDLGIVKIIEIRFL